MLDSGKRPDVLYHGSPNTEITEFKPKVSKGSGERYGALVYASPNVAAASIFLAKVSRPWSAGKFNSTFFALITDPHDEFIKNDKGGVIYVLPVDSFSPDKSRGLGMDEWASQTAVTPIEKIMCDSSLQTMLKHEVQVYFIDNDTHKNIKASADHGLSILKGLQSENQKQGIGIKPF